MQRQLRGRLKGVILQFKEILQRLKGTAQLTTQLTDQLQSRDHRIRERIIVLRAQIETMHLQVRALLITELTLDLLQITLEIRAQDQAAIIGRCDNAGIF